MIFRRKKPNRLYYPTKSRWYRPPRRNRLSLRTSRKIFSHNIRTHFSTFVKDFFLYLVVAFIFLGLVVFLLFSSKFSIASIEIARDNLHIDSTAISRLLDPYRGKSIFSFSRRQASELIQEAYPEFSQVIVRKLLPNAIKVELETHQIVANFKAYYILPKVEEVLPEADIELKQLNEALRTAFALEAPATEDKEELTPVEQKALLNRIGQAIFDQEENLELFTVTIDGLSQPIDDREIIVPLEHMDYLLNSIKYLTNLMQLEISAVRYLPVGREVHLTTDNNLTLWLALDKDYKDQIDKLDVIYKAAELNKEDLAYIDLRVREKIIYCPRNSSCDK